MNTAIAMECQEHRVSPRFPLARQLLASNLHTDKPLGSVVNLSARGFMLMSPEQQASGELLSLLLEQAQAAAGERYVRLQARCVWSAPSSFSSDYGAGFEITGMTAADQARLQRWLQATGS